MPPQHDITSLEHGDVVPKNAKSPRRSLGRRSIFALASVVLSAAATLCILHASDFREHVQGDLTKRRLLTELQSLSSLRLHFLIKRSSMYVHGQSEFDVLVNPVMSSNGSVSFEGITTFVEDDAVYEYSLVNGTAYAVTKSASNSSASCLPSSDVPPIDDILTAIKAATTVTSSVTVNDATIVSECTSGTLYQLTFSGDDLILCSSLSDSTAGFKIYGADLDIEVYYTSSSVAVTAPALSDEEAASCEQVASGTSVDVSSSTSALLSGATGDFVRRALSTEVREVSMASSTCSCSGKKRACIFYHGMGSTQELGLQDTSPTSYFGGITEHAPCCSSVKFAVLNTWDYGWTDSSLQDKTCNLALQVSSTSDNSTRTIKDTIIVTHSMGNLMVGGAVASGKCSLDSSTSWVALSGPMKGSMGSNYLQDGCTSKLTSIVSSVLDLLGQCPAKAAIASLAYQGDQYSSTSLNAQYAAAQSVYSEHVTAAMCSSSYSGLLSLYQPVFLLAGLAIPHKSSQNDGLVEFQSCAAGLDSSKFGSKYDSNYYVTGLNHMDTTFRNGDALFDNAKKPVKWFECLL